MVAPTRAHSPLVLLSLIAPLSWSCVHDQETRPLVDVDLRAPPPSAPLVIVDTRVFPATGPAVVLEHHDVVVERGRIAALRPTGAVAIPEGAVRIDGRGRTLLPGLVDAHAHTQVTGAPPWHLVHANPPHVLEEALYAGTTTLHDMGGKLEDVIALRAAVEAGAVVGPRMRVAGPIFSVPGGYPESYLARVLPSWLTALVLDPFLRKLREPADAYQYVDELAAARVDHVKVALATTPDSGAIMSPALVRALADAAHSHGLKLVAHVDTGAHARMAAENGVDVLVHGIHSDTLSDDDARAIAARGVQVVPTLITFERIWQLRFAELALPRIERETVAADIQRALVKPPDDYVLDEELAAWVEHLQVHREARLHGNVTKLRDAGVRILVGTDGHGSTASFPAGIHEEMRMLVDAGLPPGEVLMGATAWSASMTNPRPTYGTIEVGKDADLLLVEGNPLEDIGATARIVDVIQRGRRVVRHPPPPAPTE